MRVVLTNQKQETILNELLQAMHGLKTKNTVRSMAACYKLIQRKLALEQRKEDYLRYYMCTYVDCQKHY